MTQIALSTMPVLEALAQIRAGFLNTVLSLLTYLGDDKLFVVISLAVLWCFSKRGGLYMLTVGFSGTSLGQAAKLFCRIPRPWLLKPGFEIVEEARAGAAGWSFPSGHTLISVGTYGAMAAWFKGRTAKIIGIALAVIIPFSRMYLGVHTPLDVGVSAVIALIAIFALRPAFRHDGRRRIRTALILNLALAAALLIWASLTPAPAEDPDGNWADGLKNLWQLVGADAALVLAFEADERWLHYDTRAAWWAQILKIVLGSLLLLAVQTAGKKLLGAEGLGVCVTNFIAMGVACCLWPLTFKYFARTARTEGGTKL